MDINHIGLLFNEYTHRADYSFECWARYLLLIYFLLSSKLTYLQLNILISVIYPNIKLWYTMSFVLSIVMCLLNFFVLVWVVQLLINISVLSIFRYFQIFIYANYISDQFVCWLTYSIECHCWWVDGVACEHFIYICL